MAKFRDGMIGPTVILFAICLVMTFALAQTYAITKPIIDAQKQSAANAVDFEHFAGASFTELTDVVELPEGVEEAFAADDGSGYLFMAGSKGFDGLVTFIVGVDADGNYVGIVMYEHTETPGLGSKVGEESYLEQYYGLSDPYAVDVVSGASITSGALKATLELVNESYAIVKEVA